MLALGKPGLWVTILYKCSDLNACYLAIKYRKATEFGIQEEPLRHPSLV